MAAKSQSCDFVPAGEILSTACLNKVSLDHIANINSNWHAHNCLRSLWMLSVLNHPVLSTPFDTQTKIAQLKQGQKAACNTSMSQCFELEEMSFRDEAVLSANR